VRRTIPVPDVYLAHELPPGVARDRLEKHTWERATRGAYVAADRSARALVVARATGVHHRLGAPHAFSHGTAAVLHGLSVWRTPTTTHVRHVHRTSTSAAADVTRHHGFPPHSEIVDIVGLPVTDLVTSVWDCLTTLPALHALVVTDSALHAGLSRDRLEAVAATATGRGSRRGRLVLSLADDGAESPRESWTRFAFLAAGWPPPQTQVRVETRLGVFWADLGWPQWRVLVEYDGVAKYDEHGRALLAEKHRHTAISESGWRSVHVTKDDTPASILARVAALVPASELVGVRPRHTLVLAAR